MNFLDKLIRHRACTLRDTACALIKAEMDTDFEEQCQEISRTRKARLATVEPPVETKNPADVTAVQTPGEIDSAVTTQTSIKVSWLFIFLHIGCLFSPLFVTHRTTAKNRNLLTPQRRENAAKRRLGLEATPPVDATTRKTKSIWTVAPPTQHTTHSTTTAKPTVLTPTHQPLYSICLARRSTLRKERHPPRDRFRPSKSV